MIVMDITLLVSAFFIAYQIRTYLAAQYNIPQIYSMETYISMLPLIVFPWIILLYLTGNYQPIRLKSLWELIWNILMATSIAAAFFGAIAYLSKFHFLSRSLIFVIFGLGAFLILLERIGVAFFFYYFRKKGFNVRYVLIIGTKKRACAFIERIHKHPQWGFVISGLIDNDPTLVGTKVMGHNVLGTLNDVPAIFEQMTIDDIIVAVPRTWLNLIEETILYCDQLGKRISIATDLFTLPISKFRQETFHGLPILIFQSSPMRDWGLCIKRFLDIIISCTALIVLSPLFLIIIVLIKTSSKGQYLFRQIRCGLNGRKFILYKFRTMVVAAEARLEELRKYNEMSGPVFKMTDDPRLIPHGKWMRKFSVDELPQFFNVLRGDMSIVGPRPAIPSEVKKYDSWQKRRLSMRPGLTCIWQIEGRNRITSFEEWMSLDLKYIDNWSLKLDFLIFLQTIPAVIFGKGAK
jgi:exopolysaccharide biosynthesis polyprenyl glycosylphosphotransferase